MHGVDRVERGIDRDEFLAHALDVRGDGRVVDHDLGVAHQLVAAFHMARKAYERVHHPEFGHGQRHVDAVPGHAHALGLDHQWPLRDHAVGGHRFAQGFEATKQRVDARGELVQRDILGEIVVGTEAQAGDHVEIGVARGEEQDRQGRRPRTQAAAQLETTFRFVAESDIDDDQLGQPLRERGFRRIARGIAAHFVTEPRERLGIVGADQRLVFDDGNAAWHDRLLVRPGQLTQRARKRATAAAHASANCHNSSRRRHAARRRRPSPCVRMQLRSAAGEPVMNAQRPDSNAELYTREPLRVIFALVALALGLLVSLSG
jgi:hypothetical protein